MYWSKILISSLLCASLTASPLLAEEEESDEASWLDRIEIHGHLSLAHAERTATGLDGELVSDAILGLSEDGSFGYRNAALQLRYSVSGRHKIVLQLSHQKLADSVLERVTDPVEIDWLFWDWKLGPETLLRAGRLPTPAGIFNEVRDVGTVLPFFRPAFNFYREGSIFSETVDGVGLSHRFFADSPWSLESSVYMGEFEIFEQGTGLDDEFFLVQANDALGTQLWLSTPIDGARLGLGALRWDVSEESQFNSTEATWESWYASLEVNRIRWVLRCEHRVVELPFESALGTPGNAEVVATYAQVGWRPVERLAFYIQSELTDIRQQSASSVGGSFELDERDDMGIAVNYTLRPNLIFKAEYHEQEFEVATPVLIVTPDGLRIRIDSARYDNEYFIAGIAVGF